LKFKLGKLFDSYNDCKEAEEIARELGASDSIQAKYVLLCYSNLQGVYILKADVNSNWETQKQHMFT
jgi:hypothetical protein